MPESAPEQDEQPRVFVFGEITAPGVYTYTFNMRVLDAVSRARGFKVFALKEEIQIIRGDPERPEIISADLEAMFERGDRRGNHLLRPNDVVSVPRSNIGDINDFIRKVKPILDFLFYPGRFRSSYSQNTNVLKFDVGGPSAKKAERGSEGTFTPGQTTEFILR